MAVTYAFSADAGGAQRVGRQKAVSGTVTATGTYTTGGDARSASQLGLTTQQSQAVDRATTRNTNQGEALVSRYNAGTGKLQHYWTGGATGSELDEITASDTITGFSLHVTARGF